MPAAVIFVNGILLSYLFSFNFSSDTELKLLALPNFLAVIFIVPAALASDRLGKKRIGTAGLICTVTGYILITLAGSLNGIAAKQAIVAGIAVFGIGFTLFASSWLALLFPIIPQNIRGRFFGKVRTSFRAVTLVITLLTSLVLSKYSADWILQALMGFFTLMLLLRLVIYLRLPELEKKRSKQESIKHRLLYILRAPKFISYCLYMFTVSLAIGSCPFLFGLLEKDILHFTKSEIIMLGTLLLTGEIGGFYSGGKAVDHLGPRCLLVICQIAITIATLLFIFRESFPFEIMITMGFITMLWGFISAALSIAVVSELLGLIPPDNKSLSTAFATMVLIGGVVLAAMLAAKAIEYSLIPSWDFLGHTMSVYDTILLVCAATSIFALLLIRIVPFIPVHAADSPIS